MIHSKRKKWSMGFRIPSSGLVWYTVCMTKKKLGRPTVFTPETIGKLEYAAAIDCTIQEMASYAGINRDTLYSKLQDDKDFSDRINALRDKPVLKARETIVKSLDNPQDAHWYLERKRKAEFAQRVEQTGADGKDLVSSSEIESKAEEAVKKFLNK